MNDPFHGIDPPAHSLLPPDPPSFRRPCIECGKMHDTGLQNMKTGAMIERFEECKDCFMRKHFKFVPITEQVVLKNEKN